jgi:hypothetical protein
MGSTLDRTGESAPKVKQGHGTRALGPSDSSDSGSDVVGGPGLAQAEPLDLDHGTTSDPNRGGQTAGPDIGDSNLDSDSDAGGTGENIAAGRDPQEAIMQRDQLPDRIEDGGAGEDSDVAELADDTESAEDEAAGDDELPVQDRAETGNRGSSI